MEMREEQEELFETRKRAPHLTLLYRLFAASVLASIVAVLIYRVTHLHLPGGEGGWTVRTWAWIGMLAAELWFALYWLIAQSLRWNPVQRTTFKSSLSQRYENDELPGVDIFVCTADPVLEPPLMVVNTVLSVMAYDYPPGKMSVYLSDDGGSPITFYALWEASSFSRFWLPFCRAFNVPHTSPAAYFNTTPPPLPPNPHPAAFNHIKIMYEEMAARIENCAKKGRVPQEILQQHKGFNEWTSSTSKQNHQTILQILLDGRSVDVKDCEGNGMPSLVYVAREKRPEYLHNFKAGAMNALIRVSSMISKSPIILNVDCDMYSNDSQSIRDALCFFMDEKQSGDIAYVQFPQVYENMTQNDLYGSSLRIIREVDFHGLDGVGGPLYVGSGCFHIREVLCGAKYEGMDSRQRSTLLKNGDKDTTSSTMELELKARATANCSYELNTLWGKEVGLKYGCPVEDVITGLWIQCRGWRSAYYNPKRPGFVGVAPTSLNDTLVQHKRWSEGDFQISLSKYCPLWFGHSSTSPLLQMGYLYYCFWACNSLPTLFYSTVPSLLLLSHLPLYPHLLSLWFIPFAYIAIASYGYSLVEFLYVQGSISEWWNDQRMWLYKRLSSYLFAFIDSLMRLAGLSTMDFVITAKVTDEDVTRRYMKEKMEFGVSSPMFSILATLGMLNLISLLITLKEFLVGEQQFGKLGMQVILCGALVAINLPLYDALFIRSDKGRMPTSVTIRSTVLALLICVCSRMLF